MKKYTIEDFIKKNIVVLFDNEKEVLLFLNECKKYKILHSEVEEFEKTGRAVFLTNSRIQFYLRFCYSQVSTKRLIIGHIPFGWKVVKFKDFILKTNHNQEIHITIKNNETHAVLKENGKIIKHEIAKCHPDDEFDFGVGATLAFDRLLKKDKDVEKEYEDINENTESLNFSFEALNTDVGLTAGKVYDVANGYFTNDNGDLCPLSNNRFKFKSLEKYLNINKQDNNVYCSNKTIRSNWLKKLNVKQEKVSI